MDINAHRRARLQELVDREANGVVEEFARLHPLAVGATRLRQMLNPNYREGAGFKEGAARKLEKALNLPSLYFDLGIESALAGEHKTSTLDTSISAPNNGVIVKLPGTSGASMGLSNTEPGLAILGQVPLISWDQARTWDPTMNSFRDDETVRMLPCPAPHSASTFCIPNNTETMDDGTASGYRAGEILFVDPEVRLDPDRDVVVILPNGNMVFRRFKEDGEGPYLLALNGRRIDRWEEGTIIRGVVIFSGNFR